MKKRINGLIIYNKEDIDKNLFFCDHIIETGREYGLNIKLVLNDRPYREIMTDNISFVINRSRDHLISAFFEEKNIRVFNSSFVSKTANDKILTYDHLKKHGIGSLPFISFSIKDPLYNIKTLAEDLDLPLVLKPSCGHGGDRVCLIKAWNELKDNLSLFAKTGKYDRYILQKCASDTGKDLRVYVLGGRIVKAMLRENTSSLDIRANFSLGGNASVHEMTFEEKNLVQSIIRIFPSDFTGIDLIYDKGHPVFNEIEDAVGCRMLYKYTDIDIIKELINYILCQSDKFNSKQL
ncbi:MAG: ATP-grasp domain-containing protein [Lachnospiraceae bacterium]|nr:ATP-grasp domain-containing protein [Lachnospiraceae bacterium]